MRIRPASWLVATALWAGVAMSTANQIIQFQDGDFQFNNTSPNLAIISVESLAGLESKTFVWTSKKQQVSEINLYIFSKIYATATNNATSDAATGGDSSAVTTTATSVTVPSGGPKPVDSRRRRQQSEFPNTLKMTMNATDSMGSVSVDAQGLIRLASTILNSEMYFEAVWADNQGSSYSRIFTVSKDAGDSKVFEGLIQEYSNSSPAKNETGVPSSGTATATGTQVPTATGGSSESASTGGLSTGAIAGIAVACGLVGLALVGALLWFFCRKRRQDGIAPYGEVRNRTQELMAEKEANAGADVSPHSPYSDDGLSRGLHHPSDSLMAGGVAGAAAGAAAAAEYPHHQQPIGGLDRSYTPYSDQPVGSVGSPGTQRASLVPQQAESTVQQDESDSHHGPGGNRSATSASQYAHLVEDGMTADDIRRIEEEERQLDAAIERAGGRRGP